MIGTKNGKKYTLTASEKAAVLAERAALVIPVQSKVEKFVGAGANKVSVYAIIKSDLTAGQIAALQSDGYTVTQL